jgi:hypothetical protein
MILTQIVSQVLDRVLNDGKTGLRLSCLSIEDIPFDAGSDSTNDARQQVMFRRFSLDWPNAQDEFNAEGLLCLRDNVECTEPSLDSASYLFHGGGVLKVKVCAYLHRSWLVQ